MREYFVTQKSGAPELLCILDEIENWSKSKAAEANSLVLSDPESAAFIADYIHLIKTRLTKHIQNYVDERTQEEILEVYRELNTERSQLFQKILREEKSF